MSDISTPEDHREFILEEFSKLFRTKYNKGQQEHGGRLWKKNTDNFLVEEALDFISYVFTRKLQVEEAKKLLKIALLTTDWDKVKLAANLLNFGNIEGVQEQEN